MMLINQVSVFSENRSGQLADITGVLANHGIDLRAINIAESTDYGVIRIITSDVEQTISLLHENGYITSVSQVLVVGVPNRPGGLASLLRLMAEESVDIQYMYSIFGENDGSAYMIFRVANPEKVCDMLIEHEINVADGQDLGIE